MHRFLAKALLSVGFLFALVGAASAYDPSSKADRAELRARANAECRKSEHGTDRQPHIQYGQGTFYCEFAESYKRNGRRK